MLERKGQRGSVIDVNNTLISRRKWSTNDFSHKQLQDICGADYVGKTFAEL